MADLFSIPQNPSPECDGTANNPNSTLKVDGIPFVTLEDKADDFANILNFIYPNTVSAHTNYDQNVISLLGVVRIAGKYMFDDIQEWGDAQLLSNPVLLPDKDGLKTALQEGLYSHPDHCVKVILLSRECDLPQLLPLAFYALAMMEWGNTSLPNDPLCLDQLADEDRRRIQEGRISLTKAIVEGACSMPENLCTGKRCPQGIQNCRQGLPTVWLDPTARWKELVLHPLEELGFRLTESSGVLCATCLGNLHGTTRGFRDDLLERMADFFRL